MKLRPQFQLRLRDAAQFEALRDHAEHTGVSVNEYLLQSLEARMAEDGVAVQISKARSEGWSGGTR